MFSNKCLFITIIFILLICGIVIFFQTYTLGLAYIDLTAMREQIGEYESQITEHEKVISSFRDVQKKIDELQTYIKDIHIQARIKQLELEVEKCRTENNDLLEILSKKEEFRLKQKEKTKTWWDSIKEHPIFQGGADDDQNQDLEA